MALIFTLFSKFGLFAPKVETSEAFDLRLTRLQSRESRHQPKGSIFVRSQV